MGIYFCVVQDILLREKGNMEKGVYSVIIIFFKES